MKRKIFYELAGRPFGRDPIVLWAQMYLIDRGETLGDTLTLFRQAFFKSKQNYWGGMEHKFKHSMRKELARILNHRSISYSAAECVELPKVVPLKEYVDLPDEAQAYYKQFIKRLKASHASYIERKNSFIRMRQVSSGFVGLLDDETGAKVEVEFAINPKLDRTIELVEAIPTDCKFVIFHEYTHSGRMLCRALTKAKIKHDWLRGGIKNAREIQDRFDHDDRYRGLVVNWRVGAYALNLQRANYTLFFESPVAVIDREQAERRVERTGQTRTVFRIDMLCRKTVDNRILTFHREGDDLFKAIIRNPAKALRF